MIKTNQTKKSAIITSVVIFLLVGLGCEKLDADQLPRKCQAPHCAFKSTAVKWPKSDQELLNPILTKISSFGIRVPGDFQFQALGPDNLLVFKYSKEKLLSFQLFTEKTIGLLEQVTFTKSQFKVIDYPNIIFTHTSNDPEPTGKDDLYIWRSALLEKEQQFVGAKNGTIYQSDKMRVYMAQTDWVGYTASLFIVRQDNPDLFIRMLVKNFSISELESVIQAITLE